MNVFTALSSVIHFPKTVSDYLVARFPDTIRSLAVNEHVEPSSFDGVVVAKQPADLAQNLLGMNNPSLVSAWCKSRDKRQGACDTVLRHWYLPLEDQHAFASKALTDDTAREVLRSKWFADSAKLVAAPRAVPFDIWNWLESDPVDLSDEEWCKAFNLASVTTYRDQLTAVYSTLMQRPHLAMTLVADGTPATRALAVSMVPWIDADAAIALLAQEKDTDLVRLGLLQMLDHPSLPHDARVAGFALATERGVIRDVYRDGCPSPGSALAIASPLGSLTDPLQVELVVSRAFTPAHRYAHFAQLAMAPAASAATLYRMNDVSYRSVQGSPGLARPIAALAARVGGHDALARLGEMAKESADSHARSQQYAAGLKEPFQHAAGRRIHTRWYGSSEVKPLTAEELLETKIEELAAKVVGYRVAENASEVLSAVVLERLGNADDDVSKKRWENFLQLLPRTAGSVQLKALLATSVRLR